MLAARRAPRTVEAYRRDLAALGGCLGQLAVAGDARGARALPRGAARARARRRDDRAPRRRRCASFFRHQVLLGARTDNPAAELDLPRRGAPPAAHALARRGRAADRGGRGHDAARAARPRARRAALRRRPARQRGGRPRARPASTSTSGSSAASARAARSGSSRSAGSAVEALRRYLARGRPYLDRRHRPELFLNAQGGAADARRRLPDPAPPGREGRASSPSASTRTCSATRSPRTCSRAAPTCAASRRCSATPISATTELYTHVTDRRRRESYFAATRTRAAETFRGTSTSGMTVAR